MDKFLNILVTAKSVSLLHLLLGYLTPTAATKLGGRQGRAGVRWGTLGLFPISADTTLIDVIIIHKF